MALRINNHFMKFLIIIALVLVAVTGENLPVDSPVKQDSSSDKRDTNVSTEDYSSWNPTPKLPRASPAPIPHDFKRSRKLKV
ncbi:unnamed protein product [Cochlearia groenlandica]